MGIRLPIIINIACLEKIPEFRIEYFTKLNNPIKYSNSV